MRLRSEARVGMMVVSAIVVLIAVYWFLSGWGLRASSFKIYAVFPTAQKLDKGAIVRMAGVKIGLVPCTELTRSSRARVEMLIDNGVPVPRDSVARITTGGFIGENYVEVIPGASRKLIGPGQKIRSETLALPDEILEQVSVILSELEKSTKSINELVGDKQLVAATKETINSLREGAKSASELAASANGLVAGVSPEVRRILSNLADTSAGAAKMIGDLQEMVAKDVRPNVRLAMEEARAAMQKLDGSMNEAREIMDAVKQSTGKLDTALSNITNAAGEAQEMMTNLKDASGGIKEVATDQEIRENIKQAMRNAAQASEQANQLMTNLNRRFGRKVGPDPERARAVPELGVSVNSLWNTSTGGYRFDANYTFVGEDKWFYRLGGYNIGESTRANLQGGLALNDTNSLRFGLYASRVGLGYDLHFGQSFIASADVFRPNDPELELRGVLGLGSPIGIYGGVVDVLHKDRRDTLVGIRYTK